MSPSSDRIREHVHARFREAFGTPHAVEGGGANWSLAPAKHNGSAAHVHVVVTGWNTAPGVWVFDPYDPIGDVSHEIVSDVAQIEDLIASIRDRVHVPHNPNPPPGSSPGPALH